MSTYERRGFLRQSFLSAAGLAASWPLNAGFAKEGRAVSGSELTRISNVPAKLRIEVVDETGGPVWARLEIRGPEGKMYGPEPALGDGAAHHFPGIGPWYLGSFVAKGETVVEVPAGEYTVIAEHGTEYERVEKPVVVTAGQSISLRIPLKPWVRMNELGWWSADLHVHRDPADMPKLALAEDLNLSVLFTIWNKANLWQGKEWPKNPVLEVTPRHLVTLLNAEDERGGGAWLLQGLQKNLDLAVEGRWYPPGIDFVRQARAQRSDASEFPWFDCEKPFWWEVPVVMALEPPDSLGILHNHFTQYGILSMEAWGRPRDREKYPGAQGFVDYSLDLYYRYLNLGLRIPPSAGSASGVLPNPVGYNRAYVKLDKPFSVKAWYDALRSGPSFVTNGPVLFINTTNLPGGQVHVTVEARARQPLEKIEMVANGQVIGQFLAPQGARSFQAEQTLAGEHHSWLAVRCYGKSESTIRMAHSRPIPLAGTWNPREDALFFTRWVEELAEQARHDSDRFKNPAERDTVLGLYEQARRFYSEKTGPS
jgi:hypothetical protein